MSISAADPRAAAASVEDVPAEGTPAEGGLTTDRQDTDRPEKHRRLREILEARGARGIVLTQPENLSWYFDGARVRVTHGGPAVCAARVEIDGQAVLVAPANEIDRLQAEEVRGDVEFMSIPWHQPLAPGSVDVLGSGPGVLLDTDLAAELRAARASLLPLERSRYAALGADMARVMTQVLGAARPDHSEHELAAALTRAVVAAGADPVVILAAGEERARLQHPLPTSAPLGRRAMGVIGARRHGVIVSLTRWVAFGAGSGHPAATHSAADHPDDAALREVEADAYEATVPGRALSEVLADIAASYARHGFGGDAWLRHHQGGPTGYAGRDPKAGPGTADVVVAGQAFAWNPWVPGAKREDTIVIDHDRHDVLTYDPAWPGVPVRGIVRPLALTVE